MQRRFQQVDVFATRPYSGNPLAVVVDGDGLSADAMQLFANWTNLSETTFLLTPANSAADYRARIFTPTVELPFAGHPTLGSCRVWLDHGGVAKSSDVVVQQCDAGLVRIRRDHGRLAFAAPPLIRFGPVDDQLSRRLEQILRTDIVDASWVDNGPGWVAAELADARAVLDAQPDFGTGPDLMLGIVGHAPPDADHDVEVRAFFPGPTGIIEDPVTGSVNASIAQWLMTRDPSLSSHVARQGTALGRDGRVYIDRDDNGTIWVGGNVATCVEGTVHL